VTTNVVILGGGTIAANRPRRALPGDVVITVDLVRSRVRQLHGGIAFVSVAVDRVDVDTDRVYLVGGGFLLSVFSTFTGTVTSSGCTLAQTGSSYNDCVTAILIMDRVRVKD
jgi:hypothetical protein